MDFRRLSFLLQSWNKMFQDGVVLHNLHWNLSALSCTLVGVKYHLDLSHQYQIYILYIYNVNKHIIPDGSKLGLGCFHKHLKRKTFCDVAIHVHVSSCPSILFLNVAAIAVQSTAWAKLDLNHCVMIFLQSLTDWLHVEWYYCNWRRGISRNSWGEL